MNSSTADIRETLDADAALARPATAVERMMRQRLFAVMADLRDCQVTIRDGADAVVLGTPAAEATQTLHANIVVNDPGFYRLAALNGSVGAGESYMDGHWECDDLVALVRILVRNRDRLDALERGPARLGGAIMRGWHALMRNTRAGSRRNIAAHYDLGNDLFKLFLDDSMMYSSAIYMDESESLEVAAKRKLDRICQKLDLQPHHHVVEIGTGWGGFAIHAAKHYGCKVTTTTISREQYELARERVDAAGLQDRIELLLEDYRDLTGTYDRLVSIEMIEAIGPQYLDTYFEKVGALLKPDGMALIQAITIEEHRYQQALKSVDFIQRYVFPGSFIPALAPMLRAVAKNTDMKLINLEDIGPSYALTLRAWRQRFLARLSEVRALGYPTRFIRLWQFYLCYCEGGFLERSIGDVQMLLSKPGARREQFVP